MFLGCDRKTKGVANSSQRCAWAMRRSPATVDLKLTRLRLYITWLWYIMGTWSQDSLWRTVLALCFRWVSKTWLKLVRLNLNPRFAHSLWHATYGVPKILNCRDWPSYELRYWPLPQSILCCEGYLSDLCQTVVPQYGCLDLVLWHHQAYLYGSKL